MPTRPPVAPGSFLLGSVPDLRAGLLPLLERLFTEHGDVVRLRLGPPRAGRELTFTFHPDATRQILAGNAANYRKDNVNYDELRAAVGDGLLTSQDERWTRQKRFLQPLFTARRVAGYAIGMGVETEALIREWHDHPAGARDMHAAMTALSLRVACRVLFGDDAWHVLPVVQRWVEPVSHAIRDRALAPVRFPRSWPLPANRTISRGRRAFFDACDRIVAHRRSHGTSADDMLGLLVDTREDGVPLSDADIREQVLVFLLAGHETTATALTYAIHLLGRHHDVQDRVRAEADAVGGVPTAEQAAGMAYTIMTVKETMRLYPSAPVIGRRCTADDEIGGHLITAGSDVLVAPWITHRHPEFWPAPLTFDPARFEPARERARHRYAWHPFGGGPRACIGQHFSMLEATIVLAGLVREFEFDSPAEVPPYRSDVTLRPVSGAPVEVRPRRVTATP